MKIPVTFQAKIKETFYDKELALYTVSTTTDNEGFVSESLTKVDTFLGNVQFGNLEQYREEFGLEEKIDVSITTDYQVQVNDIVEYRGVWYRIIKSIPYDSHFLLIGRNYE